MADQSLVDRKLDASRRLVAAVRAEYPALLGAFWEWREERGGWVLFLVPANKREEGQLISVASRIMVEPEYGSVFSISDVFIDWRQEDRARALGSYIRRPQDIGRQLDTTFTGGYYFESVVIVYLAPELIKHYSAA